MKAFEIFGIIFRWLHFRSLDAVCVGLVWQQIFFRNWGFENHWKYPVILGSAIWLAYMADRLFDNLSLDKAKPMTRRLRFIRSHWKTIVTVWVVLFAGSLLFSTLALSRRELFGGFWLVLLIILYFLLIRISRGIPILGSLKEILTGALFSIGVSYFPLLMFQKPGATEYLDQILFALLCFSNVLLISHWDHAIDREQKEKKLSQRGIQREAILKLLLIGQGCLGILLVTLRMDLFSWALLISAIALWILHLEAKLKGTKHLKFIIDAPLILPALLLFIY